MDSKYSSRLRCLRTLKILLRENELEAGEEREGGIAHGQNGYEARSRHSSSVGCVMWSVAYALVMFVAANGMAAAALLLASDRNDEAR